MVDGRRKRRRRKVASFLKQFFSDIQRGDGIIMLMVKRLWRLLKTSISIVSTYLMHYDLMEKNIPSHQNAANLLSSAKLHLQDMYTMQLLLFVPTSIWGP